MSKDSWFGRMVDSVASADQVTFTLACELPTDDVGIISEPIVADNCYIEMFIESFRVPKSRRMTSILHGAVHSYAELQRVGEGGIKFASVIAPKELAQVDPSALGKVITGTKRLMGPTPWRGHDLSLELGLFSVKAADLASPYLDIMTNLTEVAGVSFVTAAAPFIPVIRKGVELLVTDVGTASMEVGLAIDFTQPRTGYYAIIASDRTAFSTAGLLVSSQDGRLMKDGGELTSAPYLVFRIGTTTKRDDWGNVPDLKASYQNFLGVVRTRKRNEADEALTAFSVLAYTSPDLIDSDAKRLVAKARAVMKNAFKGTLTSAPADRPDDLPDFEELDLYDEHAPNP